MDKMAKRKKRKFKPEQNITILRNGKVQRLKTPYSPEQAKNFRGGG